MLARAFAYSSGVRWPAFFAASSCASRSERVRDELGNTQAVASANQGKGARWRARYVDDRAHEHAKAFTRKVDAQQWLDKQISDHVTGTWTDPKLSGQTFGALA